MRAAALFEASLPPAPVAGRVDPVVGWFVQAATPAHESIGALVTGGPDMRWAAAVRLLTLVSTPLSFGAVVDRLAVGPWCWPQGVPAPVPALDDAARRARLVLDR